MFEDQNDKSYLKRYVQNHPTNRMAWYLLGKQYMEEGKEAKANYCFLQSGSVYEAYERKQHELAQDPSVILEQWNKKRRISRLLTRISVASVVFLGIILAAPFGLAKDEAEQDSGKETVQMKSLSAAKNGLRVAFIKPAREKTLGNALGALLTGEGNTSQTGLAVMLQQDGKWRKWTGKTRILAEAKRDGKADAAAVRLLDGQTCDCQPGNASSAFKAYGEWSREQEMRWTLSSAIVHYHERTKSWPSGMDDLTRSYPNNVLSGTSPQMKKLFPELLQAAKQRKSGKPPSGDADANAGKAGGESSNSTSASPSTAANASESKLSEAPLSIIVDKDSHQLAVVSGDVVVRSYTVGLGGKKTPSGQFFISEKVKNPNGRDDSEFGSRGMTLSNTLYAIHGTDEPDSIGKDESHGCVRMNKKDLEELYDLVPLGTKVEIKSDVLPGAATPAAERFRLKPVQDETNTAVVYRWLT
ncbi:L,D-transpeptidase [Paenibacillus lignilyticus]|uniref:L,D-transpeptidase n=1 Tax=Paenibacillus lignilyticus TaxID=1172615 RepID=A0ABS5C5Q7_9BACL|nr:L,D-transpeptidase [Paenibacillus lignilyticus]MBP3961327.1 L,D-transpeptidase [Paenibacillus lignilyticus]